MKVKIIQLPITTLSYGGDGIGKYENKICFVTGGAPGDIVRAKIIKEKKNFLRCETTEIIEKSRERIKVCCKYAYNNQTDNCNKYCPGCVYQHINYKTELYYKNKQLKEFIKKFVKIEPNMVLSPIPSPTESNYRNKITFHQKNSYFGYYSNDNKTILNVEECILAKKEINESIKKYKADSFIQKKSGKVVFRNTKKNGTFYWNENIGPKEKYITEQVLEKKILVPTCSFFQINPYSHEILSKELISIAASLKTDYLFDLYCGVGVFSILLSNFNYKSIYASDIDKNAVNTAKINAKQHKINNLKTFCGDAKNTAINVFKEIDANNTTIIIDPPRTGIDKELCLHLCKVKPRNIIYISCSPDTLCRDLNFFIDSGYKLEKARVIDMFPRTSHFETIVLLGK